MSDSITDGPYHAAHVTDDPPAYAQEIIGLRKMLAEANEKLNFLESKGLTVGKMKSSDKPEPYLVYVCEPDSEFDDTIHIRNLVDLEIQNAKLKEELAAKDAMGAEMRNVLQDLRDGNFAGTPINEDCAAWRIIDRALRLSDLGKATLERVKELGRLYGHANELLETQADQLTAAQADNARMREVLKEVEWRQSSLADYIRCTYCRNTNQMGHHPDCKLALALSTTPNDLVSVNEWKDIAEKLYEYSNPRVTKGVEYAETVQRLATARESVK